MPAHHSSDIAKQHADLFRKVALRKRLLRWATDGGAYVPFIGDGDIAVELYADRQVYGADIDADRTAVAEMRLPTAEVRVADCDFWTFRGLKDRIALADFDAYANPYKGFNDFWLKAPKRDRLVLFFTDGQGLNIEFKGRWTDPRGVIHEAPGFVTNQHAGDVNVRRSTWAFWYSRHVWPWFIELLDGKWRVIDKFRYTRGVMLYWGVAIERI